MIADCPVYKEVINWYNDNCLVRYANRNFFSRSETNPSFYVCNSVNISSYSKFAPIFDRSMLQLIENASSTLPHFASAKTNWTSIDQFYSYAECTSDVGQLECYSCLKESLNFLTGNCGTKIGGRLWMPSCLLRFELYPFLDPSSPPPPSPPRPSPPPLPNNPPDTPAPVKTVMIAGIALGVSVGLIALAVVLWLFLCRRKPTEASPYAPPDSSPTALDDGGGARSRNSGRGRLKIGQVLNIAPTLHRLALQRLDYMKSSN